MTGDFVSENRLASSRVNRRNLKLSIPQAQQIIYDFLLSIVRTLPPEAVLDEFQHLFIQQVTSSNPEVFRALSEIAFANNEEEFRNTLKRSCYILVNNWEAARQHKPIQKLVQLFGDPILYRPTVSPIMRRVRSWIINFIESQDYQDIKLFASRHDPPDDTQWSKRFTTYLLVPQYADLNNPIEQREAARNLAQQLRERFKFDLAMYIAKSQTTCSESPVSQALPKTDVQLARNPTALGDSALRLIKQIIARRGMFNYSNLANIFLNQTQTLTYEQFKRSLQEYLVFSTENRNFAKTLKILLADRLDALYTDYNNETIGESLLLRTCNRLIECLTTENRQEPSSLFVLVLSQGSPLTLVVVLLKLILICRKSRTHLEARIAELIRYYEDYPAEECSWVINFLDIFNVALAIHAENIHYDLVKPEDLDPSTNDLLVRLDDCRIFSFLRREEEAGLLDLDLSVEDTDNLPPPEALPPSSNS